MTELENLKAKPETRTVFASNLPTNCTKKIAEEYFSQIGELKKCFLVYGQDSGPFQRIAYVTYSNPEDATAAVAKLPKIPFEGESIRVKYSSQRHKSEVNDDTPIIYEKKKHKAKKDLKIPLPSQFKHKKIVRTKDEKKEAHLRKGRIIIRNLSFKATDKIVREHFSKFGTIMEVVLLRKDDGKLKGCAFVQFSNINEALKAIRESNLKPLMGRPIAVDIAVPKCVFTNVSPEKEATEKNDYKEDLKVKEEIVSSEEDSDGDNEDSNGNSEGSDVGNDDPDEDNKNNLKSELFQSARNQFPRVQGTSYSRIASRDVAEGRTLFVRNLPFDVTQDDLTEMLSCFGELKYVLMCVDPLTDHPRGTAFAQFKNSSCATACLEASKDTSQANKFVMNGRTIEVSIAISRDEIDRRRKEKLSDSAGKDTRHLYLAREGLIRAGTKAAVGLSQHDLQMRTQRERIKHTILRNLNSFVSQCRLCVHNLPPQLTDSALRNIFKKFAPQEAKMTEVRIMRDLRNLQEGGIGLSRGYGFVSFTKPEDALAALRNINNNPEVFTNDRRPIVEFSLENRIALNMRENRLEKSRAKNPLWKSKNPGTNLGNRKKGVKDRKGAIADHPMMETSEVPMQDFSGSVSVPGKGTKTRALPSHTGPKIRHHARESVPGVGKRKGTESGVFPPVKKLRQLAPLPKGEKEVKAKKNKSRAIVKDYRDEKKFCRLVDDYKTKMAAINDRQSDSYKRWFE